jgi:pimeloyl-ACP methyl ester carboxylesterase
MESRKTQARSSDGFVSFRGYRTWYRTTGDLRSGVPLVLVHGGPGIPGGSYDPLMAQLADRRPVVRYDQIGCGRSDRPNDPSLWRIETFVDELATLRDNLALDRIHLLGHSWGGMLALEYALARPRPAGVQSLVLSSTLCSTRFWIEEARRLRNAMPAHIVTSMRRFEDRYEVTGLAPTPGPVVADARPGIAPEDVARQAWMMKRLLPLMTADPVQRMASWASVAPPLRRAAYEIAGMAFMRRHVCRMPDMRSFCVRTTSRATSRCTRRCGGRASSSRPVRSPIGPSNPAWVRSMSRRSSSRVVTTRPHQRNSGACKKAFRDHDGRSWSIAPT